jgi:hypothetical protein
MGDLSGFAFVPEIPAAAPLAPASLVVEWEWSRPLSAILHSGRFTIHSVINEARPAAEVRVLWKLFKSSERLAREREARLQRGERLEWRRQGLPVICPICGSRAPCGCAVAPLSRVEAAGLCP